MTATELHIQFELALQGLTVRPIGKPKPQEVDWYINSEVDHYVNSLLSGVYTPNRQAYQATQKRIDDIRKLLTTPVVSPLTYIYDDKFVYCRLPYNYMHLDSSRSEIVYRCKNGNTTLPTLQQNEYYVVWTPESWSITSLFRLNYNLASGGVPIELLNVATDGFNTGYVSTEAEDYMFINYVLQTVATKTGYQCYYENYNNEFYPNSFIFIVPASGSLQFVNYIGTGVTLTISAEANQLTKFIAPTGTKKLATKKVRNRVEATDKYDITSDNSYSKTSIKSTLSKIENNGLYVEYNKDFGIIDMSLTYIKKSDLVSFYLNKGLDLPSYVCREIVGNAALHYKADKGSPSHQMSAAEQTKIE